MKRNSELKVFISNRDSTCDDCGEKLGRKAWITMEEEKGALCLVCADMEHLIFLPAGNTALTRRARKHSTLVVIVLKWSRSRKRYERQGLLVEEKALEQAEHECLADSEVRARRRERAAEKRAEVDEKYVQTFAEKVRKSYPGSPPGRENIIAEHACLKYSGRIGRTESAKILDEEAIRLAVIAHIRHTDTRYDELLSQGYDRRKARNQVKEKVHTILSEWK
ncbi:MAG: DUF2293 domain-containing protein [Planctomycetes bacterium]|nr:DUF2293 domain-containing protein [Planctomycetota bacterium]